MRAFRKRSLRSRVLEEWRGLPEPVRSRDRTVSLAETVPAFLKGLGLEERYHEEEMMRAWRDLVGDFIAEHSRPLKIQGGVLVVQVLQPTLHYDLERTLKGRLLKKIQDRFGARKIRDIRFMRG